MVELDLIPTSVPDYFGFIKSAFRNPMLAEWMVVKEGLGQRLIDLVEINPFLGNPSDRGR
jgi:hypothetical protein